MIDLRFTAPHYLCLVKLGAPRSSTYSLFKCQFMCICKCHLNSSFKLGTLLSPIYLFCATIHARGSSWCPLVFCRISWENAKSGISSTNLQILHDEILLCQLVPSRRHRKCPVYQSILRPVQQTIHHRTIVSPFFSLSLARNLLTNDENDDDVVVECVSSYQCRILVIAVDYYDSPFH